ncbi:MAG: hypothetical protein HUJ70_05055, partial [Pseudobutyrivibrio sp.]|nr:hypothetical protein [Pseudobutyrivibrio sp.]
IIERRVSNKPYYTINDTMLVFWYKYVNRAVSLINAGNGKAYYLNSVAPQLHHFMGTVFEKMCKEFLFMKAGQEGYPLVAEIDNLKKTVIDEEGHQKQIEIDLLGKNGKDILLVGECKFKESKVDKFEFETFLEKVKYVNVKDALVCIFSLSGYTDYVRDNSGNVQLLTIDDLYF